MKKKLMIIFMLLIMVYVSNTYEITKRQHYKSSYIGINGARVSDSQTVQWNK
ncbi:hypothetical protein [Mycoplasma sp. P36-A1]|uniref:hypothetical protein n=1 Tax=Mycoplasma sp. P36-A1 TaxID=3252900 RepID=UPI003C2BA9C7